MITTNLTSKRFIYLILFFVFVLLFPFPEVKSTFNWNSTCDALHLPLFFTACYLLYQYLKTNTKKPLNLQPKHIAFLIFLAGLTIEIIQPLFSRGFSIKDITTNFFGTLIFYLYVSQKRGLLTFTALLASCFVLIPIFNDYKLYQKRLISFPILFDPSTVLIKAAESSFDSKLTTPSKTCELEIVPSKKKWSGVKINMGYSNWERYRTLAIALKNPKDSPMNLGLRIDDDGDSKEFENRYNSDIYLPANSNIELEIPIASISKKVTARKFNLTKIKRILIFATDSNKEYCLGKIQLK